MVSPLATSFNIPHCFSKCRIWKVGVEGTVRSVSLAFAVLRHMAANGGELSLSEVSRMMAVSPSSCLAILRTLVSEGALEVRPRKRYAVAAGWDAVGGLLASPEERLLDRAQPMLERVAQAQDAAVGLWRMNEHERVELVRLGESNSAMRIHMVIGQRQPIGAGSIGRVLAAAQNASEAEIGRRFRALRWHCPITLAKYRDEIAQAMRQGYAIDDGFAFAGVASVAVAVRASPIRLCISASTFAGSRDNAGLDMLGAALMMVAARIEEHA